MPGNPLAFFSGASAAVVTPPPTISYASGYPVISGASRLFTMDPSKSATVTFFSGANVETVADASGSGSVTFTIPTGDNPFVLTPNVFGTKAGLVPSNVTSFNGTYNTTGSLAGANAAGAVLLVFKQTLGNGWRQFILGSGAGAQIFCYSSAAGAFSFSSNNGGNVVGGIAANQATVVLVRWTSAELALFSNRFATAKSTISPALSPPVVLDQLQITANLATSGNPVITLGLIDVFEGTPTDADSASLVAAAAAWGAIV